MIYEFDSVVDVCEVEVNISNFVRRSRLLFRALRGDTHLRHVLALRVFQRLDPGNFLGESGKTWISEAQGLFDQLSIDSEYFEIRAERLFVVREVVRELDGLPGDLAEFGVHKGTSALVMLSSSDQGRYYGVDSFEGLSEPIAGVDGSYWSRGALAVAFDDAKDRLSGWEDRATLVKGWIPDCLGQLPADLKVRFAHVDVDLYEPTLSSLEFVGPRMVSGGVIICDDYGFVTCPGARQAVDEFIGAYPEFRMIHLPTGQGLLIRA